jgi:glycosyltransferase involved in cell wall biosynthesis
MKNGDFFLKRLMDSIEKQTYKDYEVVITKDGRMAENTNSAIKKAKGDIVKIIYMDDYFAHENSLQEIADNFTAGWLVTGCLHDYGDSIKNPHYPSWNQSIYKENTIGSPSVLAFENKDPLMFDEEMSWTLDSDYYMRLFNRYGYPKILPSLNVIIGIGDHQMTSILTQGEKLEEEDIMKKRYEKRP